MTRLSLTSLTHRIAPPLRDLWSQRASPDQEELFCNLDLRGVERPRTQATHEERVAELCFARSCVGKVSERSVERLDPRGSAGIDHFRNGVVPEILLRRCARLFAIGIRQHFVHGVTAADTCGLHGARRGKVGWP